MAVRGEAAHPDSELQEGVSDKKYKIHQSVLGAAEKSHPSVLPLVYDIFF